MFPATIFSTEHLFKACTANVINAFLAALTGVGGAMWDQQSTSADLCCGSTPRGQAHTDTRQCSTTQRCASKQEGARDRAWHPGTCQTSPTAGPRTLCLCKVELWPLLDPVTDSMPSCEPPLNPVFHGGKHTKLTARSESHNHQTKDLSLKILQFFIQILTGDAPSPYPGVFSLWELCSYPVTFLWACRILTWSPTQAREASWLPHLLSSPSALADKDRLVTDLHPPTVDAAAVLASLYSQLLHNLIFTPFCRGILKQTPHSLPPQASTILWSILNHTPLGQGTQQHDHNTCVTQITDLGSDLRSLLAWGASLQISSTSLGLLCANSDDTLQTNPG